LEGNSKNKKNEIIMKVLLITDGITPFVMGGMQRHSANVAKYLTLAGVEVTLVHCVADGEKIPSEDDVNQSLLLKERRLTKVIGFNFPSMGKMPGHYLKESFQYSEMVFTKVKDDLEQFDFIYAKGFTAWKLLHKKSKGMQMPPIGVKFHGYEMYQKPPSFRAKVERLFLRKPVKWNTTNADFVFSYGAKITDLIKGLGVADDRIISIPSGIDDSWIRESPLLVKKPVKFVFLGRYERRKGVEELNVVLKEIIQSENFEFHFIGPIPKEKQIDNSRILYHGPVQDKEKLIDLLDSGDVLVCPSHSEGMPNVILEGMARGMAVIATNVGAVKLLFSKDIGILIERINILDLKNAITTLSKMSEAELIMMKKNSLSVVEKEFKWERIANKLIESIDKVTGGK